MWGREIINNSQLAFANRNSFSYNLVSFYNEKSFVDVTVKVPMIYFILLITNDMFLFK